MPTISEKYSDPIQLLATETLDSHTSAFKGGTLLYSQHGDFDNHLASDILPNIERIITDAGGGRHVMRRIGNVIIEALQNAANHGAKTKSGSNFGQLSLMTSDTRFSLKISNLTLRKDAETLIRKIDDLNNLNKSEVRKLFIEILCNEEFSSKGGAGLGLITMAKKADHPIEVDSKDVGADLAYLSLTMLFTRS